VLASRATVEEMLRVLLVLMFAVFSVLPGEAAAVVAPLEDTAEQSDQHASDCCSSCPGDDLGDDCCEEGCGACCVAGSAGLTASSGSVLREQQGRSVPLRTSLSPVLRPMATGPPPLPPPIG